MKRIFTIVFGLVLTAALMAQPAKSRLQTTKAKTEQKAQQQQSIRKFPSSPKISEDVTWRRDIYRTLDLTKDANAPLYYPLEPIGKQMNLFTYLFRLMLSGRVTAYNYSLDGNEHYEESNKVKLKDFMERYNIFNEEKDGKLVVAAQDIPSAEVTRYYIKESSVFDQRTSTYTRRVTALCPVLMRGADEFSSDATPYPLFWLKYEDIASYLGRLPVMASNLNNVTNMTADDFFTMNLYDGKIYKTNNLQGRPLQSYCKDDSAMVKEQNRIEKELVDFESGIWTVQKPDTAQVDSTAAALPKDSKAVKKEQAKSKSDKTRRSKAASKTQKSSSRSSVSGSRVSARRQRR